MITKLSDELIKHSRGLNILILFLLVLIFNRFLFPLFITRFGPGHNYPMLDSLFGFSPDQAYYLLSKYGEAGRKGYIITLLAGDVIFPFVYGALLSLILGQLLKLTGFEGTALQKLNLVPLTALTADLVENAGIISMIGFFPAQSKPVAMMTAFMGMAKWVLVTLSILMIIGWAIYGVTGMLKRK